MISAPAAIRLGFTQAASRWATGLFAVLASCAEVLAGMTLMLGALALMLGHERAGPAALLAAVLGLLAARIMLALVHGGAIRQSARWLRGESSGTTLEELFHAAPYALGWLLWTLPLELLGALWKWVGLAALLWAFGHALAARSGGVSASLALAMFLTLVLPLALFWALVRRTALVAAVRDGLGPLDAALEAVDRIANRPLAYVGVLIVGLSGALAADVFLSMFGGALSPDGGELEPALASQLVGGVLAAFTGALFELVILFGFTALESEPAAPPPLPVAPVSPQPVT